MSTRQSSSVSNNSDGAFAHNNFRTVLLTVAFVVLFIPFMTFADPSKIPADSAAQNKFAEFQKKMALVVGDPKVDAVFSNFFTELKGKNENVLFAKIGRPTKIELLNGTRYLHYDFPKCDYTFCSRDTVLESASKNAKSF